MQRGGESTATRLRTPSLATPLKPRAHGSRLPSDRTQHLRLPRSPRRMGKGRPTKRGDGSRRTGRYEPQIKTTQGHQSVNQQFKLKASSHADGVHFLEAVKTSQQHAPKMRFGIYAQANSANRSREEGHVLTSLIPPMMAQLDLQWAIVGHYGDASTGSQHFPELERLFNDGVINAIAVRCLDCLTRGSNGTEVLFQLQNAGVSVLVGRKPTARS